MATLDCERSAFHGEAKSVVSLEAVQPDLLPWCMTLLSVSPVLLPCGPSGAGWQPGPPNRDQGGLFHLEIHVSVPAAMAMVCFSHMSLPCQVAKEKNELSPALEVASISFVRFLLCPLLFLSLITRLMSRYACICSFLGFHDVMASESYVPTTVLPHFSS